MVFLRQSTAKPGEYQLPWTFPPSYAPLLAPYWLPGFSRVQYPQSTRGTHHNHHKVGPHSEMLTVNHTRWYHPTSNIVPDIERADALLQAICVAKDSMKNAQVAGLVYFSRLTNVAAALLQIGMIKSIYEEDLREFGLEVLGAICDYLKYQGPAIVPTRGSCWFPTSNDVQLI